MAISLILCRREPNTILAKQIDYEESGVSFRHPIANMLIWTLVAGLAIACAPLGAEQTTRIALNIDNSSSATTKSDKSSKDLNLSRVTDSKPQPGSLGKKTNPATEGWLIPAAEKIALPRTAKQVKTKSADDSGIDFDSVYFLVKEDRSAIDLRAIGDQILKYRRRVTDESQNPSLRTRLAAYLYLAGDLEGAAAEDKRAIALSPNDYFAHAFLARIMDEAGDRELSSSEYRRAIELARDSADAHLLYADSCYSHGELSTAINEFRRAIAIKPSAEAYSGLAEALVLFNDSQGAIKAARHAVSINPGSATAHVALTKALVLAGETHASLRTARQAVLLNPSSADSHVALGRALYAKGDRASAVDEFKQAVALDPLNAQARNDLGYALYGQGDILSAVDEFRLALRLNPHMSEARNNLEIAIHGLMGKKKF
jgi:Flp pilus assembly protein TadD